MAYARRVDGNQPEIVQALRCVGASVTHLHTVGHGVPDILVGFRGVTYLMGIKTTKGRLTRDEKRWINDWCGQVAVVRSVDEALATVGAIIDG